MNGTIQTLRSKRSGNRIQVTGVLVRDYPVLIRLT
jgi:hypothetical protein